MFTKKEESEIYECKMCDFICSKKYNWDRHITTRKHKMLTNEGKKSTTRKYMCDCGKEYSHRQSLHYHKKTCEFIKTEYSHDTNESSTTTSKTTIYNDEYNTIRIEKRAVDVVTQNQIIQDLLRQNQEFISQNQEFKTLIIEQQEKLMELSSKPNTIINNNNVNSNNKFNLNLFLHEKCKDAISLMDFVNSLQLQLSDLENTAKLGYVDGITKIILDGIKDLDIHKRPIHCTDLKRETIYIKDHDTWERENEDKTHLKKAINVVSHKNIQQIPRWQEENPDCMDVTHPKSMEYLNIMINANGGNTNEIEKNTEKIIKKLTREVIV